jgi:predicted Fe-Mo cluster-binding NifX family protein
MKIAIPTTAPDLGASVASRLGTAAYLLVIDLEDLSFEAVAGLPPSAGPGAGIEAISIVTGMGAKAILAGYISPHIALTLEENGIAVVTPLSGSLMDAIAKYRPGAFLRVTGDPQQPDVQVASHAGPQMREAFRKAARQFFSMFPVLVGLFRGFMSWELLLTIFSGNVIQDTFGGACIGSVLSGNPVNSYVVGETLPKMGVSLFGAAALMLTRVNVGAAATSSRNIGSWCTVRHRLVDRNFSNGHWGIDRDRDFTWGACVMQTVGHDAKSKTNRKRQQWLFPIGMVAVYMAIYFVTPEPTVNALMASGTVLKQMVLPLLLAFVMMVVLNLFVTPAACPCFALSGRPGRNNGRIALVGCRRLVNGACVCMAAIFSSDPGKGRI